MKNIFLIAAIVFSVAASAQVTKVSLQASGLTCSMCSNSINKALRTLDFVDKIDANIKTSTFEITFKNGEGVDFDKLKKKVEDAGFSVARFIATVHFNNVQAKANEPVQVGDKTFQFINLKGGELNGDRQVTIIDKGFVSTKEFRNNPVAPVAGVRVYHVLI